MDHAMNADGCRVIRTELGAYVLDALEPADRARVDAHLAHCATCRHELEGLAPLPALLAGVPELEPVDAADGPSGAADRLLAELARVRRRRRRAQVAVAAACVVIGIGAFGLSRALGPGGAHAQVIQGHSAVTHVAGRVSLVATPEGSSLEIALTGVPPGTRCELVVVGAGGRREVAATWRASYDGTASVRGASAMSPAQVTELVVVAGPGSPLLVLPRGAGES